MSHFHKTRYGIRVFETQQRHRFRTIEESARFDVGCGSVDHATLAQLRDLTTPRRASRDRGRE